MSPQFVDFDADGNKDLVMGTFEGVAFLVPGSKTGFGKPIRILDKKKRTILLSQFWNNQASKWDSADRSPRGKSNPDDHCISVVAFDYDGDGDLDLLLGAKEGRIYLRRNKGKKGKPSFTTYNEPVRVGSKPLKVPGGLTAPRVVDWNGDGKLDLVCGSFDGGVYLYENRGSKKAKFRGPKVLVPAGNGDRWVDASTAGLPVEPTRPTSGVYVDAVDYDGDGDLDLLVGGSCAWKPNERALTPDERKKADKLVAREATVKKELTRLMRKGKKLDEKQQKRLAQLHQEQEALDKQIAAYVPRPRQAEFVWLYRRL